MRFSRGFLTIAILFCSVGAFAQSKDAITFQGYLKSPSGTSPTATGVTAKVQILSPVAEPPADSRCVLREEVHTGLAITDGYFNLVLGNGTASSGEGSLNPSSVLSLTQALDNSTSRSSLKCFGSSGGTASSGSYSPLAADGRRVRVVMTIGSGHSAEQVIGEFNIRGVAYATHAATLSGKTPDQFISVSNATNQNRIDDIMNRYDTLKGFLDDIQADGATQLQCSNVTGVVSLANGGTGAATQAGAANAILPAQSGQSGKYLTTDGNNVSWATVSGGGSGSVTYVDVAVPSFMSVSGGPVTSSGTITLGFGSQGTSKVLAGPSSGSAAPTFRNLTIADIQTGAGLAFLGAATACPTGQVLNYNLPTDQLTCQSYVLADGAVTSASISANAITTTKIADGAVTSAKINDVAWSKVTDKPTTLSGYGITDSLVINKGSVSGVSASPTAPSSPVAGDVWIDTNNQRLQRFDGTGWVIIGSGRAGDLSGTLPADRLPALTGDVTSSAGSNSITLNTVPIEKGGTGATTQAGAANAILPSQASQSGKVLSTDGTNVSWVTPANGDITAVNAGAGLANGGTSGDVTVNIGAGTGVVVSADTVGVDAGLGIGKIPQVGATALGAGGVVTANTVGSGLASLNCTAGQVIKFNASGFAACDSDLGANSFVSGGNSLGAAATLGTNDNFSLTLETNDSPRITVTADGNVGVGTNNPSVALEVSGAITADSINISSAMKLTRNASAPLSCNASTDGSMAMTSGYTTCVCRNGSGWVSTSDGATPCYWTPALQLAATSGSPSNMNITSGVEGFTSTSSNVTFTVTNSSATTSPVIFFSLSNTTNFEFNGGTCSSGVTTLAAGASCTIIVRSRASSNGALSGTLNLSTLNNPSSALSGTASGFASCPANYVPVPGLLPYTSSTFCVAKFEMKNVSGVATSQSSGTPWVSISRGTDATTAGGAWKACRDIGTGYDLISNAQWQTIARNLEGVGFNWSGGTVGNAGGMNRGHSDNSPGSALAASTDDNPCSGTGQACDLSTWNDQRRVHRLQSGDYVWDFAGNVWEWVKDGNSTNFGADAYISTITPVNHPNTGTIGGVLNNANYHFGPAGDYTTLSSSPYGGLGHGWLNYSAGAIHRGGSYYDGVTTGVFTVKLTVGPTGADPSLGFRCVWSP